MATMTTTVDPRSAGYVDRRQSMLARLEELDEALGRARTRVRARERIELLLDRDAPFLELYPVAGACLVGGIGAVEGVDCVLVAQEPGVPDDAGDRGKAYRLAGVAAGYGLPLVHLAEPGRTWRELRRAGTLVGVGTPYGDVTVGPAGTDADFIAQDERDAIRLARLCVRRLGRPPVPAPPGPGDPPLFETEDLLGTAEVPEILARLLDGSEFDEFQPGTGPLAGWGAVHGYPVGVLEGEESGSAKAIRFGELVRGGGIPLVTVHTTPEFRLALGGLSFGWPGADEGTDVVIDPRDTRTAVGIALRAGRGSM